MLSMMQLLVVLIFVVCTQPMIVHDQHTDVLLHNIIIRHILHFHL